MLKNRWSYSQTMNPLRNPWRMIHLSFSKAVGSPTCFISFLYLFMAQNNYTNPEGKENIDYSPNKWKGVRLVEDLEIHTKEETFLYDLAHNLAILLAVGTGKKGSWIDMVGISDGYFILGKVRIRFSGLNSHEYNLCSSYLHLWLNLQIYVHCPINQFNVLCRTPADLTVIESAV